MNNSEFYSSFQFDSMGFHEEHNTDMRLGSPMNFLALMKKGMARIETEIDTIELQPGDLFLIPKGLPYVSHWYPDGAVEWDYYGFEVLPEQNNRRFFLQKIEYGVDELVILRKLSGNNKVNPLSVGLLYTLLGMLEGKMSYTEQEDIGDTLHKAIKVMSTNMTMTVPEIAKVCRISTSGLYSIFRTRMKCTPIEYKHYIQCENAKALLRQTDYDIETVSELLSFSSSSYFRKVFFKVTGKTPSQIRRERGMI